MSWACADCGGSKVRHAARGLCRTCYSRNNVAGTIERYAKQAPRERTTPLRNPPGSDVRYARWLNSTSSLDSAVISPWIESMIEGGRDVKTIGQAIGVDESYMRRLRSGAYRKVAVRVADRIAMAAGAQSELASMVDDLGDDDWSPMGRWCGDGSRLGDGCGSWHHPHERHGLCAECVLIAGGADIVPRDVRMAKGARREVA